MWINSLAEPYHQFATGFTYHSEATTCAKHRSGLGTWPSVWFGESYDFCSDDDGKVTTTSPFHKPTTQQQQLQQPRNGGSVMDAGGDDQQTTQTTTG